jgi:hypothetical protein
MSACGTKRTNSIAAVMSANDPKRTLVPETYAALLRFADWIWQESLNALSAAGDTIPGARKLTNVARQGFSGHHFVIMALCSMIAAFLVNAFFAFATRPQETTPGAADSRTNSASKDSELGRGGREAEPVNRNDSRDVTSTHPLRRPQGWHGLITLA